MTKSGTTRICAVLTLLAGIAVLSSPTYPQPVRHLVLKSAVADSGGECTVLHIAFTLPLRYLRHNPAYSGSSLHIQVRPVELSAAAKEGLGGREAVRVRSDDPVPLGVVVYDGTTGDGPTVVIDFGRPLRFAVSQGRDFRSLFVSIAELDTGEICKPML